MKKILIIVVAVFAVIFIYKKCKTIVTETPITGYQAIVANVENGNILVLNTGLRVQMLGVKENHERTEVWIKNNLVGKPVELVSDSGNEQGFTNYDDIVKAYVNIIINDTRICANRMLIADNKDCYTQAYLNDSTFQSSDQIPTEIHDKALYMKQRTMLVETSSGIGTGFFINKQGIALTNHHVLDGNKPACVFLYAEDAEDSKIYTSRRRNIRNILWTNDVLDITVFSVELEAGEEVPYFNLISNHEPQGNECFILGNPQGLYASFAKGVISAYREEDNGRMLVQYDLATNGGNSGGPVMNSKGQIIAVHALGQKSQTNGAAAQGLNFGIDILQVRQIVDQPGMNINYGGK